MASVQKYAQVAKVDESLGLVFGYAITCTVDGEPYVDTQSDHIPPDAMLKAVTDFMKSSRVAKEMHAGEQKGTVVGSFPMTDEIAKAFGIETNVEGWLVAVQFDDPEVLAKFARSEYTGFSIGGFVEDYEEVTDG